jgi:hypothetical protein
MIGHSNFNLSDKEMIVRRIADIQDKKCYIDFFKLLIKKNISYMKNKNGIFFNVSILSDDVLNIIDNILTYHEMKKEKIFNNNMY